MNNEETSALLRAAVFLRNLVERSTFSFGTAELRSVSRSLDEIDGLLKHLTTTPEDNVDVGEVINGPDALNELEKSSEGGE